MRVMRVCMCRCISYHNISCAQHWLNNKLISNVVAYCIDLMTRLHLSFSFSLSLSLNVVSHNILYIYIYIDISLDKCYCMCVLYVGNEKMHYYFSPTPHRSSVYAPRNVANIQLNVEHYFCRILHQLCEEHNRPRAHQVHVEHLLMNQKAETI